MITPKAATCRLLQIFLYLAAFYLSVQVPAGLKTQSPDKQFLFEQQSICLIPMEVRGNKLLNNPVNLIPLYIFPFSGLVESYRLNADVTLSIFNESTSGALFPFREIVITTRRLRI